MPRPIVAGNWKMNTTLAEGIALASQIAVTSGDVQGIEVVLCPPFVSLAAVTEVVKGTAIKVGAQNMYHEQKGAFTGEVSPLMLAGLCQYVILGHSERRHILGETDEMVHRKVEAAMAAGLRPIVCVGETLPEKEAGEAAAVVSGQVRHALDGLHNVDGLVVAYEPVWAIGTGVAATPETAVDIMGGVIRPTLEDVLGTGEAPSVPLLYGGSVSPRNVVDFLSQECIDGALVGGASLDASQFSEIVKLTVRAKARG